MGNVAPSSSYVLFVYPLAFERETFGARVTAVERARWAGREERPLVVWQRAGFPVDDLLPHVARYFNPPADTPATAYLWTADGNALGSTRGLGTQQNVCWALRWDGREIPFQIREARLALFQTGAGFLTVQVCLSSENVDEWLDFLYAFRFAGGQRGVCLRLERQTQDGTVPYFPPVAGGLEKYPDGCGHFGAVLDALLHTASIEGDAERWWHEVFVSGQLIPYAVLYVDGVREDEVALLLYQIRNFFPSERQIHPSTEDLRLDSGAYLAYAHHQYFVFSLEGSAFVAFDAPPTDFFRRELPAHLRTHYFLMFLLALHQRFTLLRLSDAVARYWFISEEEQLAAFERIQDGLLEFTARGRFVQVVQREHHHRVYRRWLEVYELDQLYQEVNDEVRDMYALLMLRQTREEEASARRIERLVGLLGAIIGVPALVLTFLNINLLGVTAAEEGLSLRAALLITAGSLVVGALTGICLQLLARRSRRSQLKQDDTTSNQLARG